LGQRPLVPLLLLGPPFFPIILFGSTTLLTGMTGISLHMQWPLASQREQRTQDRCKRRVTEIRFNLEMKLTKEPYAYLYAHVGTPSTQAFSQLVVKNDSFSNHTLFCRGVLKKTFCRSCFVLSVSSSSSLMDRRVNGKVRPVQQAPDHRSVLNSKFCVTAIANKLIYICTRCLE
jgi:hypothetical protein